MAVATHPWAATMTPVDQAGQGRIGIIALIVVLAQLALLTLVLRQFQIESTAFLELWLLAISGFVVHALLPLRHRLLFFIGLSLAGIALVLGPVNGAMLVAIGLVLIGICHLPFAFATRVAILIAVACILAAQRTQWIPMPWSEAIWPILGSMFMFRLIVYLYDLKHDRGPASPLHALSYFFMLPNACFPLFPVVDYKTFRRNYFNDDTYRIYQTGLNWMVRGVIHLILYRIIYYYVALAPSEVHTPAEFAQYLVSAFLLYLRVSGLFHLIVGMLHLFGFRLPETNHKYFLASSILDHWRRINIYWKDFMLKVFYYPAYFKLRRYGDTTALVLGMVVVVFASWFLHAYQWFWLRGSVFFLWQDILFWMILGALMVVNALWEVKHGRERKLGKGSWTWSGLAVRTLKILATFTFISILWSFWTADSVPEWLALWRMFGERVAANGGPFTVLVGATMLAAVTTGGGGSGGLKQRQSKPSMIPSTVQTVLSLAVLLVIGIEGIYTHFGPKVATFIQPLRSGQLSRLDMAKMERGYYEKLMRVDRFNSQLWEVYSKRPKSWLDTQGGQLKRHIGGFAQTALIPSFVAHLEFGRVSTNRWGMRDQDYELKPATGTFRAALLGASSVMGWGVGDGGTFEALVEARLNREQAGAPFRKYEILNFAVPGYYPPQQLAAFERALDFGPDAVFYVATGRELSRATVYLAEVLRKQIDIPYPGLAAIATKAGLAADMDEATALRRLEPFQSDVLSAVYRRIAETSRARGIVPVWIFLPQISRGAWEEETAPTLRLAEDAGFVIVNLDDVFRGEDIAAIRLAEWDEHPNARGHNLVGERLYQLLQTKRDVVFSAAAR
jgi:D-alanyl-lipoteichoic acid acyltransferase DltB (MBOAT superfamily)